MKRYGIIGGTFDPIHYAHLYIAYEAQKQLNLDKVIFMPAGKQPLKTGNKVTEPDLRYEMVKMAIEPFDEFSISSYELEKKGLSFTYETLEYLTENKIENDIEIIGENNKSVGENNYLKSNKGKEKELFFITGADCLMDIEKWREVSRIFSLCTLVVFVRGGFNKEDLIKQKVMIEEKYNGNIIVLDLIELEISSTDIRERIKDNKRIDFFVPPKVVKFIYENKLYTK